MSTARFFGPSSYHRQNPHVLRHTILVTVREPGQAAVFTRNLRQLDKRAPKVIVPVNHVRCPLLRATGSRTPGSGAIPGNDLEPVPLTSRCYSWLRRLMWDREEKAVNGEYLKTAAGTLSAHAEFSGEVRHLYTRAAWHEGILY